MPELAEKECMTSVFDFTDYRIFLRTHLAQLPKKGHGVLSQWAKTLNVSTTLISQILSGGKSLNLEVAMGLAQLLELSPKEVDHFLLLVEFERAGTKTLQIYFKKKIEESQAASRQLKNRIEDVEDLSPEVKAHYYASWVYSAIRNLVAAEPHASLDELAKRLKISRLSALEATEFLQKNGLLVTEKNGWSIGPRSIYLTSDSPLVNKHHQNWRIKSLQTMDAKHEEDLFFTSPMSLSKSVAAQLRKDLVDLIQEARKKAGPSEPETVRCLNIDWFEY
jgi:uncharacterized protein (TIGR02147 family)